MEDILVPIFVCVVLPVAIVLISSITKMNTDKKRTEIIMRAIEANKDIDTEKLIESLQEPRKNAREILNTRLLRGCMFTFTGIALVIVGIINIFSGSDFSDDPVTVPMVFGGIALAIGLSYVVVYFVTRDQADSSK